MVGVGCTRELGFFFPQGFEFAVPVFLQAGDDRTRRELVLSLQCGSYISSSPFLSSHRLVVTVRMQC